MWCTRFYLLTAKYSGTVNISISGMWLLSWPLHSPRIFRCFGELLSVDSIWFRREVYSKSLVGPLAPGSLESAESYLYFAIDKWWQNTVLYSGRRLTKFSRNCYRKTIFAPDNPTSHHTSEHGLAGLIPAACQVQHVSDGGQLTVRVISLKHR